MSLFYESTIGHLYASLAVSTNATTDCLPTAHLMLCAIPPMAYQCLVPAQCADSGVRPAQSDTGLLSRL